MPCDCGGTCETNLVYACSGAANTGLLADQVMRALNHDGVVADSTCLAAIAADLSGFLESARNATRNIVIDGCKVSCGKRIFEKNGIPFQHFVMTDFDVEKGKTAITGDLIKMIAEQIGQHITDSVKA